MIKQFNKNGAITLYKREFADCLEACDYQGAIDNLIKFSEAAENPDFHAAMGILYFLFTQDSDEKELLPLAYREFLTHLITHPDSHVAYRSLLAVAMLRRDPASIVDVSDFISRRGVDVRALADELSEFGLDAFTDDGAYIDFDGMFLPADFGVIGELVTPCVDEDLDFGPNAKTELKAAQQPKIIKFKGGKNDSAVRPAPEQHKIMPINRDENEDGIDFGDMFDMMMQLIRDDEKDDDEDDIAVAVSESVEADGDIRAKLSLTKAQKLCAVGKFDEALSELDCVHRDAGKLYYCAECLRANIMIERDRFDDAQSALDRAFGVVPDGALVGTIQCSLYEATKRFELIPAALKKINVADYIDSDHVYRALRLAMQYCKPDEAMSLAEQYVDEFNSFDLRTLYAQMRYNAGDAEWATKELRLLSKVLYDDFNAQYFYLMAKAGIEKMPVEDDTPQRILGMVVDNIIALVHSDVFLSELQIIQSEPFKYGLEVFLTLEFQNTRAVMRIMFDTLDALAADKRLEGAMRAALVSPYVEPLVKAVILGKLLAAYNGNTPFLVENSFCPISEAQLPSLGKTSNSGVFAAYALAVMFCPRSLDYFVNTAGRYERAFNKLRIAERDVAYFLWRTVKAEAGYKDEDVDGRVHYALGFSSKAQANAAYKATKAALEKY